MATPRKTYGPLKAKKCVKGDTCGGTCIKRGNVCYVNVSNKSSQAIDTAVRVIKTKSTVLKPSEYTPLNRRDSELETSKTAGMDERRVDGDVIRYHVQGAKITDSELADATAVSKLKSEWNGEVYRVDWTLIPAPTTLTPKEKLKATLEARKMWPDVMRTIPEGSVIYSSADGGADSVRDRIYRKGGLSPANTKGNMYGIIRNSKLEPLNLFPPDVTSYAFNRALRQDGMDIAGLYRNRDNILQKTQASIQTEFGDWPTGLEELIAQNS